MSASSTFFARTSFLAFIMKSFIPSVSRRVVSIPIQKQRSNWLRNGLKRRLATAASNSKAASLPLAGIKVLDMTRVLAGVREEL